MITSHGLHLFSKWAISEEGNESRSGEGLAQYQTKDCRDPNRESSHFRLCRYHSDFTTKNRAPSTSTSMIHLHMMSKKQLKSEAEFSLSGP